MSGCCLKVRIFASYLSHANMDVVQKWEFLVSERIGTTSNLQKMSKTYCRLSSDSRNLSSLISYIDLKFSTFSI